MATIAPFISNAGETVTWQQRTLGLPDAVTGWPAVSWAAGGDIKALFRKMGVREAEPHAGRITEVRLKMYTYSLVQHRDRIVYGGQTYEVESAPEDYNLRGTFVYRACILVLVSV